jgi:hypothetical protein
VRVFPNVVKVVTGEVVKAGTVEVEVVKLEVETNEVNVLVEVDDATVNVDVNVVVASV